MAKKHSGLTTSDLHHPKGILVESTASMLVMSQSINTVTGSFHFIPDATNTYTLGNAARAWKELYVSTSSINFVDPAGNTVHSIQATADGITFVSSSGEVADVSGSVISGSKLHIVGDTFIGGDLTLGDADSDSISIGADLTSNLIPNANATYDIGSATKGWNDLHLGAAGVINWANGGITLTETSDVLVQAGGNLRVPRLEIDSAADYVDVDTDLKIIAAADIILDPGGNNVLPGSDDADDLGASGTQWKDLYIDGVAYIDTLNADALGANLDHGNFNSTNVDIDSGAIDGTIIGANSAAAGTFAALVGTSLNVSEGNITNVGDIALDTISADDGSSLSFSNNWTNAGRTVADLGIVTTVDINGGTIDGAIIGGASAGAITGTTIDATTDFTIGSTVITDDSIVMTPTSGDTATIAASTNGALTITTVDTAAAAANLLFTIDGTAEIASAGLITLDSGGAINLEPAAGSAILLDGTISVDAGVVTGATSITSTDLIGTNVDGIIGADTARAGTFTTLSATGDVDLGDATGDTITATGRFDSDIVPSTDSARDLGTSALQFAEAHIDTGHIDAITATGTSTLTTVDINGGNIDGTVIGAASAAAGTFAAIVGTSLNVSDGNITNVGSIALDSIAADDGSSFTISNNWTNAGNTIADLGSVTTCDINGGTINGITDLAVADGGTGASSLTDGGVLLGSGTSAVTAMAVLADGEFIVGDGSTDPVAESGNTARTSLGLGTGDTPVFAGVEGGEINIGITGDNEIDTDSGNLTIDSAGGTITLDDNVIVSGDFTVSGTRTIVNSTTVDIADNIIELNAGTSDGGLYVKETSGGAATGSMLWDVSSNRWFAGTAGSETNVVLVDSSDTLTNKTLTTPTIGSFTNATHDHADAAGGGVIALGTATSGNYVATITGGTSITSTAATSGEGTTHSLSVDDVFVRNDGNDTSSGTITAGGFTTAGNLTLGGHAVDDIDITSEASDADDHLMTAAAIKARIDDLKGVTSNVAGTGISVSGATGAVTITNSGVTQLSVGSGLDVDANTGSITLSVDLAEVTTETSIAQDDTVLMVDATDNGTGKISFTNFEDEIFGNISGDATAAAGGALSLAANCVDSSELVNGSVDDGHLSDGVATGLAGAGMTATSGVLNVIASTGITVNADNITTNDGQIVHDSLSGFVANEHIDHSGVTLTAGSGLNGGGDITTNRTFAVDAAQTVITSLLATDIKIGEDNETKIDFETADTINFYTNNVHEFQMTSGGTFHADADVVAYSSTVASDEKLKTNINDTKYGLSDILKLRGVDFNWKEKFEGKRDVGFIAQEVQEIIPELVKEVDTIGTKQGEEGGGTHLTVDYAKVVPILVESIRELKKEIDDLKSN